MAKTPSLTVALIHLATLLLLTGCPEEGCENGVPSMLLDYTGLSGCSWIIQLQSGEKLEPLNLEDFDLTPADSMLVHVTYEKKPTMMSVCMVGKMVEITCIKKLSDEYREQFISTTPQNTYEPQTKPPAGVPAYPNLISYRLPDDYLLEIYLKGDEFGHIITTKDGYLLMMNQDGFYEYAIKTDGQMKLSGIIARNKKDRDKEAKEFLKSIHNIQ